MIIDWCITQIYDMNLYSYNEIPNFMLMYNDIIYIVSYFDGYNISCLEFLHKVKILCHNLFFSRYLFDAV
jgi:hypothetical protein